MYVIRHCQTGRYLNAAGAWVRAKEEAKRFGRYVDAFNSRPLGGSVIEV